MAYGDVNASILEGYWTQAEFDANPLLVLGAGQRINLLQTGTYKLGDGAAQLQNLSFLGGASGSGTVTSINATIPAGAIAISGVPITTNGTIAMAWQGSSSQYVLGDGSLATKITNNNQLTNGAGYITDVSGLVPYINASGPVDLNNQNLTNVKYLQVNAPGTSIVPLRFTPGGTVPLVTATGDIYWSTSSGLTVVNKNAVSNGLTVTNGTELAFIAPVPGTVYMGGGGNVDLVIYNGSSAILINSTGSRPVTFSPIFPAANSAQVSVISVGIMPNTFAVRNDTDTADYFSVSNAGVVTINDGTQVNGYVLTCNASGVASWQAGGGGGGAPALTATHVPFGDAGGLMTSDGNMTFTIVGSVYKFSVATAVQMGLDSSGNGFYLGVGSISVGNQNTNGGKAIFKSSGETEIRSLNTKVLSFSDSAGVSIINVAAMQVGNIGLSTGTMYQDTAANILANSDNIVALKV